MNQNYRKIKSNIRAELSALFLIILSLFIFSTAFAANKTFSGTGNFSDPARWNGGTLPNAGDSLTITGNCTVDDNARTDTTIFGNLRIGALTADTLRWPVGGTCRLNVFKVYGVCSTSQIQANGGTLIVRGDFEVRWATYYGSAASTIKLTGPATQTLSYSATTLYLYNLIVDKPAGSIVTSTMLTGVGIQTSMQLISGEFTLPAAFSFSGDVTLSGGTFSCTSMRGGGDLTIDSSVNFSSGTQIIFEGSGGSQTVGGTKSNLAFATTFVNRTLSGTVTFLSGVSTVTTGNFTILAGVFNAPQTLTINGTLSMGGTFNAGASLTITGNVGLNSGTMVAGANIYARANWNKAAAFTFTPGTGTVTFNGNTRQLLGGLATSQTFNNVTIDKPNDSLVTVTVATLRTLTIKDLNIVSGDFSFPSIPSTLNITGNWNTAGGSTFFPANGKVNFNGSSGAQTLGGAGTNNFDTLRISNASGIILGGDISVARNLDLSAGPVSLEDGDLTLSSTADILNYTSARYIISKNSSDGGSLVQTVSGGSKFYPIGTSTYTPATVNNTGAADKFRVRVFNGVYTNGVSGSGMSRGVNRTWLLEEDTIGGSIVTLTLQWDSVDENPSFNRDNCGIFHYTAGNWEHPPTYDLAGGAGPYTISRSGINSFSPFGAGDDLEPLPVELLSFSAMPLNKVVILKWVTATEVNNNHFEIERSADGQNFEAIGRTEGSGNSNTVLSYAFTDNDPIQAGISYYRLKQVDYDGSSSYSSVQVIKKLESTITLGDAYPIPVKETLSIPLQNTLKGTFLVEIHELTGRVLYTESFSLPAGSQTLSLPTADLPQGLYLLTIINGAEKLSMKLVK